MIKTLARSLSLGLVLATVTVASAHARKHQGESTPTFDRHNANGFAVQPGATQRKAAGLKRIKHDRRIRDDRRQLNRRYAVRHRIEGRSEVQLLPHPSGCPSRAFCGCGASIEVFGRSIRELWLARNWFKFPPAAPGPGMVAVRRHHIFVIREVRGPGLVLAFDANSGGHKTRIHLRSLAGYSVRNPHGSRYATAI